MTGNNTFLSLGDFIDLYHKIKQKGWIEILSKFYLSSDARTASKWNRITSSSDFWVIPEIRRRWNEKCTGDPDLEYEDYVVSKYFSHANDLKMLSVGCGTGARERKFAKYLNFSKIEGVDLAEKQIEEAKIHASESKLQNIRYFAGEFTSLNFEQGTYDAVLFNSSLHHFKDVNKLLETKVSPLLKTNGYLLIFEYVGPNRLQWTQQQLEFANQLLRDLPLKYKTRYDSKSIKRRIYRPGLIRMLLVDPSEAIDSEAILPSLHQHFKTIEEKRLGWDITHLLFKDIAHNFLNKDEETKLLLSVLFDKEDEYLSRTGHSDAVFGVYQK